MLRGTVGFRGAHSKLELQRSNSGETIGQSDNSSLAKPPGGHSRPENETRAILTSKSLFGNNPPNVSTKIYILWALVLEYLIKGELTTLVGLYVTGIVSKA